MLRRFCVTDKTSMIWKRAIILPQNASVDFFHTSVALLLVLNCMWALEILMLQGFPVRLPLVAGPVTQV